MGLDRAKQIHQAVLATFGLSPGFNLCLSWVPRLDEPCSFSRSYLRGKPCGGLSGGVFQAGKVLTVSSVGSHRGR